MCHVKKVTIKSYTLQILLLNLVTHPLALASFFIFFQINFDQTERNMRNLFLEKSYAKCSGETTSRPFSIKSKSLDLKFYTVYFHCMAS